MNEPTVFRPARLGVGALYALVGHAVVLAAAFVSQFFVKPSAGGFQDLAAVVLTGIGGEALLGIVSLIWGALLFRKGDRELGLGLVGGWLLGLAILALIFRFSS